MTARVSRRWNVAVVLAGGKSRRMQRDKAQMKLRGTPALERRVSQLAEHFDTVMVSLAAPAGPRGAALLERVEQRIGRSVPVVCDTVADGGPLAALHATLGQLPPGHAPASPPAARAFVTAVDCPEFSPELAGILWEAAAAPDCLAAVPKWDRGLEPLAAVYRRDLRPLIGRRLAAGKRSLHSLVGLAGVREVDLGRRELRSRLLGRQGSEAELAAFCARLFVNLNTPAEVARWERAVD